MKVTWSQHFAVPVQNPDEALLPFQAHVHDEPAQLLSSGLTDKKGRREAAEFSHQMCIWHI